MSEDDELLHEIGETDVARMGLGEMIGEGFVALRATVEVEGGGGAGQVGSASRGGQGTGYLGRHRHWRGLRRGGGGDKGIRLLLFHPKQSHLGQISRRHKTQGRHGPSGPRGGVSVGSGLKALPKGIAPMGKVGCGGNGAKHSEDVTPIIKRGVMDNDMDIVGEDGLEDTAIPGEVALGGKRVAKRRV